MTLSVPSPGVTPVDGAPHQPHSECYPVLLDGVMVGWVDKELAPSVAASLRHFKVTLSLCELFPPLIISFSPRLVVEVAPGHSRVLANLGGQKLILGSASHFLVLTL